MIKNTVRIPIRGLAIVVARALDIAVDMDELPDEAIELTSEIPVAAFATNLKAILEATDSIKTLIQELEDDDAQKRAERASDAFANAFTRHAERGRDGASVKPDDNGANGDSDPGGDVDDIGTHCDTSV